MAAGGWGQAEWAWGPHGQTDGEYVAAVQDFCDAVTGFANWSEKKAPATMTSSSTAGQRRYWAVLQHTSGAELCIVVHGNLNNSADTLPSANMRGAPSYTYTQFANTVMAAWIAPGKTGFDSASYEPKDTAFMPSDAFKFLIMHGSITQKTSAVYSGGNHSCRVVVRGDDVHLCFERDYHLASGVDAWTFCGTGLVGLAQSGDTNAECRLLQEDGPYYTDSVYPDFYNTSGDVVLGSVVDRTEYLAGTVNSAAPWNAVQMELYATIAQGGVSATNGVKGKINTEMAYFSSPSIPVKNTIGGGTHIHVVGGLVIGWDGANPSWP